MVTSPITLGDPKPPKSPYFVAFRVAVTREDTDIGVGIDVILKTNPIAYG